MSTFQGHYFTGHHQPLYSLVTHNNVRYEGTEPMVSPTQVKLHTVRVLGTENREPKDSPRYVPPGNDVYSYILFDRNDIVSLDLTQNPQMFNPFGMPGPQGSNHNYPFPNQYGFSPNVHPAVPQQQPAPVKSQPTQPASASLDTKANEKQGTSAQTQPKPAEQPSTKSTEPVPSSLPTGHPTQQRVQQPKATQATSTPTPAPSAMPALLTPQQVTAQTQPPIVSPVPSKPVSSPKEQQTPQEVATPNTSEPKQATGKLAQQQQRKGPRGAQEPQKRSEAYQPKQQGKTHQPRQGNNQGNRSQAPSSRAGPNTRQEARDPPKPVAPATKQPAWGIKGIGAAIVAGTAESNPEFQQKVAQPQGGQDRQPERRQNPKPNGQNQWQVKNTQPSKPASTTTKQPVPTSGSTQAKQSPQPAWGSPATRTSAPAQQQRGAPRNFNEMDIEAATAMFDKEQFFREQQTDKKQVAQVDHDPFFDIGLSTDASDAKSEPRTRGGWQKQREKERKTDELTFGSAEVVAYEKSLHHQQRDQNFSRPHLQHGANRGPHGHHHRPIQQPRAHHGK